MLRYIKKALLLLLISLVILIALIFLFFPGPYQYDQKTLTNDPILRTYKKGDYLSKIDSLRNIYGSNKIIPSEFELQILLALSHFPELKNTHMRFTLEEAFIPLSSRPNWKTMFFRKKNWEYLIVISIKSSKDIENILLRKLPFNAQIGVLGHEISHTVYYQDKGLLGICKIAINYLYADYRANFEKDTDLRTIYHGLGWQLYDESKFVLTGIAAPEHDKYIEEYYMGPDSIQSKIKSLQIYDGKDQ